MADPQQPRPRKKATNNPRRPIVVRPPRTAPLSDEDRQQAVTALAAMIADWWAEHQSSKRTGRPDNRGR